MEVNVRQNTQFIKANYNKEKKVWIVETKVSNGKIKYLLISNDEASTGVQSIQANTATNGCFIEL